MEYIKLFLILLILNYMIGLFFIPFFLPLLSLMIKKLGIGIKLNPLDSSIESQPVFKVVPENFVIVKTISSGWPRLRFLRPQFLFKNRIDVLIPAHNEEKNLAVTIEFIRKACMRNGVNCRIIVGLDLCEDQSIEVAKKWADVVVGISYRSKWKTLNHLLKFASAEWVAFVDVGTIWNSEFVEEFQKYQNTDKLMFIAPSYKQIGASRLQRAHWSLERQLKSIENRVGGPISVHGATVLYKLIPLRTTLSYLLSRDEWFNDDVIIPLTMRILFPHFRGMYLYNVAVLDLPMLKNDIHRRRRISFGNLQVLEFIENKKIVLDTVTSLLWNRRKYRIFWAYFLGLTVLLVGLFIPVNGQIRAFFMISVLIPCCGSKAFRASLLALAELVKLKIKKTVSVTNVKWK